MFRGRTARKEFLSAKLSMVRFQAMVKAMLARRKYNSLRKGGLMRVATVWRA
jgi:IQ calmodulin-binding motif